MKLYAQDALALLAHLGWTEAHVLAFSFGAAVLQEMLLIPGQEFRALRVLFVCPAVDVDGTPIGSFPLGDLIDLDAEERDIRMLLLADTRRDDDWLESDEGANAQYYLRTVRQGQEDLTGGLEGRNWQMRARQSHATESRLREAVARRRERDDEEELPRALYDEAAIFASLHDGITPPHAVLRLHAALDAPLLVWFPAGHWPNLARECPGHFGEASLAFLLGRDLPPAVVDASRKAAGAIPATPPPLRSFAGRSFGGMDCLSGCVVL